MASPSAGAPALKYGDVNTEATSPGEAKGLIKILEIQKRNKNRKTYIKNSEKKLKIWKKEARTLDIILEMEENIPKEIKKGKRENKTIVEMFKEKNKTTNTDKNMDLC